MLKKQAEFYFSAARVPRESRELLVTQNEEREDPLNQVKDGKASQGGWNLEPGRAGVTIKPADPGPTPRKGSQRRRRGSLRCRRE